MGETDTGGNWVLIWWEEPCSVNLLSNFLLMGKAVFLPCCLTFDQTMVEVMKIMASSFKSSHTWTVTLSAPGPSAGHCLPTPTPEAPGHSHVSLGLSLIWSLLLSPGSWCAQGFVCALQESVSPALWKFWWFCGGVNGSLLQGGLCHTSSAALLHPEPLPLWQAIAHPYLYRRHSNTGLAQSLRGPLMHVRFYLSTLRISGRYGVWF